MRLFEGITVGGMELKNRIVMPPMGTLFANPDGSMSQRLIDYYARRAEGGTALVIVEIAEVDAEQFPEPRNIKICDDRYLPGLSALASAIKAGGAKAAIQLHHPGRQTRSKVTGVQPVAPSPIPCPLMREVPRELSEEEIKVLIRQYAEAAWRAKEAGFDAIELHGAHGYLICQFLSPFSNHRNDSYGGDTRRRAQFALDTLALCREMVGQGYPILFRFSADEHVQGGLNLAETLEIARLLEQAGADCLSVSAGNYAAMEWAIQTVHFPQACLAPLAAEVKKTVSVPVITAGRINDPKVAERVLEQGQADLIAVGRGLLADPDFAKKASEGHFGEIRKCIACMSCHDVLYQPAPLACLMNPEMGRESEKETPAEKPKRVLVLGGGPAGLEAAWVAAQRGHQVTLWDENSSLGGRWAWMIRPYIKDRLGELKKMRVRVDLGKAITPEAVTEAAPEVVVATRGATPVASDIPGADNPNVVQADDILEGRARVAGKVVIMGGGNIGCETAEVLRRRGVDCTIVESGRRIGYGIEAITRKVVRENLHKRRVNLLPNTRITRIEGNRVHCKDEEGREGTLEADTVVLALGHEENDELIHSLRGLGLNILPLAFCNGPQFAYYAAQEGAAVARQI